jgi:hypothetical protein
MGRKRKHTTGKYDRKPPFTVGQRVGHDGTITDANAGQDEWKHLLVRVKWDCSRSCKNCHGESQLVRADYLRSRRVVSCGKVKRALRSQYMLEQNARDEASKLPGVDSVTGKPIVTKGET